MVHAMRTIINETRCGIGDAASEDDYLKEIPERNTLATVFRESYINI